MSALIHVTTYSSNWLLIESLDQLFSNEKQIIERIATTLNGGNLFLANPLLLFADLGIELSEHARAQLIAHEPLLGDAGEMPYRALKMSDVAQAASVRLHGLFDRKSK
jgi:hypothetical protein